MDSRPGSCKLLSKDKNADDSHDAESLQRRLIPVSHHKPSYVHLPTFKGFPANAPSCKIKFLNGFTRSLCSPTKLSLDTCKAMHCDCFEMTIPPVEGLHIMHSTQQYSMPLFRVQTPSPKPCAGSSLFSHNLASSIVCAGGRVPEFLFRTEIRLRSQSLGLLTIPSTRCPALAVYLLQCWGLHHEPLSA